MLGRDVDPKALCDDRLARVLRYLARDRVWAAFEAALGGRLVRVYALPEGPVRVDMSTVRVHADAEGLVPFGFSQAHRPDLPQVKVGMATLDPLGMPLATLVVAVQITGKVGEAEVTWPEERWVIREKAATRRALAQLERRLEQAAAELQALNARGRGKRRYRTGRRWSLGWRASWPNTR